MFLSYKTFHYFAEIFSMKIATLKSNDLAKIKIKSEKFAKVRKKDNQS